MTTKELYTQKLQAQLDEWKADIAKLKARAEGESADAQLALHKQVESLERGVAEAEKKLRELAAASEEAWDTVSNNIEAAWHSLKTAVTDAYAKLKS
ncbi:MAG TPA: hypothetical protein VFW49_10895 [Fluviicoccus sp.]|nr:hypothetical protein [Fluviicoccus sp.]